jgi:peptidoglycan L-alanyl-D-glutamate endopeptidase CwlK
MSFKFSERSLNVLDSVNPDLQAVCMRAIEISKVDFGIPSNGGLRSDEEQNRLFHAGKSKLDGYEKKSKHQSGNAIDVYAFVDGRASWMPQHLTHVATAMLAAASELGVQLRWGGHWRNFVDMPHFEVGK